jgi:hypothetical protein
LKITSTSTLTGSVHTTVNALREAIAVQRMLERDARGGSNSKITSIGNKGRSALLRPRQATSKVIFTLTRALYIIMLSLTIGFVMKTSSLLLLFLSMMVLILNLIII